MKIFANLRDSCDPKGPSSHLETVLFVLKKQHWYIGKETLNIEAQNSKFSQSGEHEHFLLSDCFY